VLGAGSRVLKKVCMHVVVVVVDYTCTTRMYMYHEIEYHETLLPSRPVDVPRDE